jgi:hypothetical protein
MQALSTLSTPSLPLRMQTEHSFPLLQAVTATTLTPPYYYPTIMTSSYSYCNPHGYHWYGYSYWDGDLRQLLWSWQQLWAKKATSISAQEDQEGHDPSYSRSWFSCYHPRSQLLFLLHPSCPAYCMAIITHHIRAIAATATLAACCHLPLPQILLP